MTHPTGPDWINAARDIWNSDCESDVWIPESDDSPCCVGYTLDILGQQDTTVGAWVAGARVWISREQLDAYLNQQAGDGDGPRLPIITYVSQ